MFDRVRPDDPFFEIQTCKGIRCLQRYFRGTVRFFSGYCADCWQREQRMEGKMTAMVVYDHRKPISLDEWLAKHPHDNSDTYLTAVLHYKGAAREDVWEDTKITAERLAKRVFDHKIDFNRPYEVFYNHEMREWVVRGVPRLPRYSDAELLWHESRGKRGIAPAHHPDGPRQADRNLQLAEPDLPYDDDRKD